MKMGDFVMYISKGVLEYGQIIYQRDNIVTIKGNKKVIRKKVSQLAWEVSDEFRKVGLDVFRKSENQTRGVPTVSSCRYSSGMD